jgi:hypothetical protein
MGFYQNRVIWVFLAFQYPPKLQRQPDKAQVALLYVFLSD